MEISEFSEALMIPNSFNYHQPSSIEEAIKLLTTDDDSLILAGGHSLIPMMKQRMAQPRHLIDLQKIENLKGITVTNQRVSIGAMTTQAELIASDALKQVCPIIQDTSLLIADPQVRNCGTIGGNLASDKPGNDLPAVMIALNAEYKITGKQGDYLIPARKFYKSAFKTALNENEILTSVHFSAPAAGHGYAFYKQKPKIGDYATTSVAVILTKSDDRCTHASIGITNVSNTSLYVKEASESLIGSTLDDAIISIAVEKAIAIANPVSDRHGPAEFKKKLIDVMVRRAIEKANNLAD